MKEDLYTTNCIRTFTGKYFNVLQPDPEMVCLQDVAHALSHMPRFAGHTEKLYTVAQHSLLVAGKMHPHHALDALMHDASEAYVMDIPGPLKQHLPRYKAIEKRVMQAIARRFALGNTTRPEIKAVDAYMLRWEWQHIVLGKASHLVMDADEAKQAFIDAFFKYQKTQPKP